MIRSPYQQNINIMKDFFRKPVVLLLSVFTFLTLIFQITVSFLNPFGAIVNRFLSSYLNSIGASQVNVNQTAPPSVNLFSSVSFSSILTILFAVAFLLMYLQSKQEKANLSAPSTLFKVISIIKSKSRVRGQSRCRNVGRFKRCFMRDPHSALCNAFT